MVNVLLHQYYEAQIDLRRKKEGVVFFKGVYYSFDDLCDIMNTATVGLYVCVA